MNLSDHKFGPARITF
ncbi:unnamed protein product [Victoria cruziana]